MFTPIAHLKGKILRTACIYFSDHSKFPRIYPREKVREFRIIWKIMQIHVFLIFFPLFLHDSNFFHNSISTQFFFHLIFLGAVKLQYQIGLYNIPDGSNYYGQLRVKGRHNKLKSQQLWVKKCHGLFLVVAFPILSAFWPKGSLKTIAVV